MLRALLLTFLSATVCYYTGMLIKVFAYNKMAAAVTGSTEEEIFLSDAFLYETFFRGDEAIEAFGTYTFYVKSIYYYLGIEGDAEATASILDDYFAASTPQTNDYTGISEGNNLIMILMESFEYFAIDEELTPTLYRLFYEDGILLDNYHSKAKTDIVEAYSLFGSFPSQGSLFRNYYNDTFPFTLPNMLRDNTDITLIKSYHNNEGSFYNRSNAHVNFGFDEHVDLDKMDITIDDYWVNSDYEMLLDQADAMIPDDGTPFFTFITSFVMHGGYEERTMFADTYAYFDEIGFYPGTSFYHTCMRTYMAAAMDFDKALEVLFQRLEDTGTLENTTIVLFSDHLAYYYDFSYMVRGLSKANTANPENYHLPALIYDTKLKEALADDGLTTISKFVTTVDLPPTILNLFGVEYNPDWYVGFDIFSADESVIVSKQGGIFNDRYYTVDGTTILSQATDATLDEWLAFKSDAIRAISKTNHLNLVYSIDYFAKKEIDTGD